MIVSRGGEIGGWNTVISSSGPACAEIPEPNSASIRFNGHKAPF